MPYKLNGNCVVKADTGKTVKCHPTHAAALAHLRALEANVADPVKNYEQVVKQQNTDTAEKKPAILDQQETAYTPVSTVPGQACAGCMWYRGNYCHIVVNWPENIEPTGWCNEYRVATPPPLNLDNAIPVVLVDAPMLAEQEMALPMPETRRSLADFVIQTVKGILAPQPPAKPLETPYKAFTAWKGKDGEWYWLARHTGKWVDREDEILADHAHEEFVQRVQSGKVPLPELWTWHKKGTMHGQADFVWKAGGFTLALGHFVGTKEQKERAAEYYNAHEIKLSHMFKYPKNGKRGKVYHAYNTVEITTLPPGAEAFPYTTFEVNEMPLTKDQLEMIRGIGGDEMVTRAEAADAKALGDTAKLDASGVASKNAPSADNFEGSNIPGAEEEKALLVAQKDLNDRLEKVEKLSETVAAQDTTIKALLGEVGTLKTQLTSAVERGNDLEKRLAEYQAVAPPASKSNDTILGDRETSLLQKIAQDAKTGDSLSLIEQAFGGKAKEPAV